MKIAITADVHLRSQEETPERYNALTNILSQCDSQGIEVLIVAGDLFDKEYQNYSEFEALCAESPNVQLHIIPGNHDPGLRPENIVSVNVTIYVEPTPVLWDSTTFLFVPYIAGKTMGQQIAEAGEHLMPDQWILVGHGDYLPGTLVPNPHEPGIYMPLTRATIDQTSPRAVLLGHIHAAYSAEQVHYAGSPCGIDLSETGRRRFLLYDTATGIVTHNTVDTDRLYFDEEFTLVPMDDEIVRLEEAIEVRIASWDLQESEYEKVRLRVRANGYVKDRNAATEILKCGFRRFAMDGPNVEELSTSLDTQLNAIACQTRVLIEGADWDFGGDEPSRSEVLRAALLVIYGD